MQRPRRVSARHERGRPHRRLTKIEAQEFDDRVAVAPFNAVFGDQRRCALEEDPEATPVAWSAARQAPNQFEVDDGGDLAKNVMAGNSSIEREADVGALVGPSCDPSWAAPPSETLGETMRWPDYRLRQ